MLAEKNNSSNKTQIKLITIIGLLINLFLVGIKLFFGILGKSQAVIADAFHSLSDMITDIAVIIGVKYWEPPADAQHPYGHKKIENAITLIIGIVLGFVGLEVIINAIKTVPNSHTQRTLWLSAIGPLLSIITKEMLYHATIIVGKKVKSSAVMANAWHHRSDALSSIPAFIAVLVASFFPQYSFIDHIGAVVIAVFIFKVAWDIIKPAFIILIDSGATQREIKEIAKIALATQGVRSLHKIRTRKISDNYLIDMHVLVDGNLSVTAGHDISEKVKLNLIQKGPNIIDVVIHLEPYVE